MEVKEQEREVVGWTERSVQRSEGKRRRRKGYQVNLRKPMLSFPGVFLGGNGGEQLPYGGADGEQLLSSGGGGGGSIMFRGQGHLLSRL